MRRNRKTNPKIEKQLAKRRYAERQIEKWYKWSFEMRGRIKFSELTEIQERYGIICYG